MQARKKKTKRSDAKQVAYEKKIAALRANYIERRFGSTADQKATTAKQNRKRFHDTYTKIISTITTRSHA
jgi:hypothetical protein